MALAHSHDFFPEDESRLLGRAQLVAVPDVVDERAYHLSDAHLDRIEAEIAEGVHSLGRVASDIVAVTVPWDSEYADFGRTTETIAYGDYDNHEQMKPHEKNSLFILTFDTDVNKVAHVKRIVTPNPGGIDDDGMTGIEAIDDRLKAPEGSVEHVNLEDVLAYHGMDSALGAWNVTSNHTTKRGVHDFLAKPYVLVSYKSVFELGRRAGIENLFAYFNEKAVASLGQLGLSYELIAGEPHHLPDPSKESGYDDGYTGVVIPYSDENMSMFTTVREDVLATQLIGNREVPIYNSDSWQ